MSGVEVCGIVLGVLPLAISALEHYKTGKGAANTFVKWRGHLDTLIFRLKLQRTFFYLQVLELLREMGVAEMDSVIDLSEEECVAVLRDKQTGDEIREYLGGLHDTFLEIMSRYERCLKTIVGKLGHIRRLQNVAQDDLVAILAANPPQEGKFAFKERITFTIERGSLKKLLEELKEDRLSLKVIIKAKRTQQDYLAKESGRSANRLATKFGRIQQTACSLVSALSRSCACHCADDHVVLMRLDNRATAQRPRARIGRRTHDPTTFSLFMNIGVSFQELAVNAYEYEDDVSGAHSINHSSHVPHHIPIITFAPAQVGNTPVDRKSPVALSDLCQHACSAYKARCMLCLDLIADTLSVASAGLKDSLTTVSASITLSDFLRHGYLDEDVRMTPKQQTILALDVAASVLQLRGTSWARATWNSKCIQCVVTGTTAEVRACGLFVKETLTRGAPPHPHGGDGCRPRASGGPDTPLGGPGPPKPKETLRELAILLLEIWHHKPLEMWWASARPAARGGAPGEEPWPPPTATTNTTNIITLDTPEMRTIAAIRWLEATAERLPPHHLAAVEHCLAVCSGRLRAWDDGEFQRQFCENVVRPLQESCRAWQP